jgi:hypothetical protein
MGIETYVRCTVRYRSPELVPICRMMKAIRHYSTHDGRDKECHATRLEFVPNLGLIGTHPAAPRSVSNNKCAAT